MLFLKNIDIYTFKTEDIMRITEILSLVYDYVELFFKKLKLIQIKISFENFVLKSNIERLIVQN